MGRTQRSCQDQCRRHRSPYPTRTAVPRAAVVAALIQSHPVASGEQVARDGEEVARQHAAPGVGRERSEPAPVASSQAEDALEEGDAGFDARSKVSQLAKDALALGHLRDLEPDMLA